MKKIRMCVKKIMVTILVTAIAINGMDNINFTVIAEENVSISDYVILTKSNDKQRMVANILNDKNIEDIYNNVIVAEISEKKAKELSEDKEIIVEKNLVLEANSAKKINKRKVDLYNRIEQNDKNIRNNEKTEWNIQAINVDKVNAELKDKRKVKVAVLDSGVDNVSGIDLMGSINFVDIQEEFPIWYQDITGHGTNIASIIAGNSDNVVKGVNPNVELYSVKVLDENNQAPISRIIKGIYWCIENDINIINMSFGTKKMPKALKEAIDDAYEANILMVAAAGNNGGDVEYPAAFENVMAVASTNPEAKISEFSNEGKELDVAAPGEKIRVLGFFGLDGITHGTSIAVPHIVGVASLLWEKDLRKSNDFIKQLIKYSAKKISNTENCGLVDAKKALELYDKFEIEYDNMERKNIGSINEEAIESFEEVENDEAYVEGRWGGESHKELASNNTIDSTLLAVLKAGAVYPDRSDTTMDGGTTYNPQYHGGFKDGVGDPVNYIACYEFVTRIALKNGDATSFTNYKTIVGLEKDNFDWIKEDFKGKGVGGKTWGEIFSEIKVNGVAVQNNNINKKYFTWGIALHIIGDTFAHKTYRKSDKKQIVHSNATSNQINGADNTAVVKGRWEAAKLAAKSSISSLLINDYGDFNEFEYAVRKQPLKDKKELFLKKRFSRYIESNGGTVNSYVSGANID